MTETDGFEELIGEVAKELEDKALVTLMNSALKAMHMCALLFKEAMNAGFSREIAESMAVGVWRIVMTPFMVTEDGTTGAAFEDPE